MGVTKALASAPVGSESGSCEELVLALCGLIDCCAAELGERRRNATTAGGKSHKEAWAVSLGRGGTAMHDQMVAHWVLNEELWRCRHLKRGWWRIGHSLFDISLLHPTHGARRG